MSTTIDITPTYLIGPVDFDDCRIAISREDALKPYANSSTLAMQKAFSYWSNRLMNEREAENIRQTYPKEVQIIRSHLWQIISRHDVDNAEKDRCCNSSSCESSNSSDKLAVAAVTTIIALVVLCIVEIAK